MIYQKLSLVLWMLSVGLSGFTPQLMAAKVVEESGDDEPDSVEQEEAPEAPRKGRRGGRGGRPRMGLSLAINPFPSSLGAHATLTFPFNRYVALAPSGYYSSVTDEDRKKIAYGPELDLILSLANSTFATPFVGAGPGIDYWVREEDSVEFDHGRSLTTNYFVGINFRFNSFIGLQLMNKWVTFLNDPPLKFGVPHNKREEKNQSRFIVGFFIVI